MSIDEQSRFEQTVIRLGNEPVAARQPPLRSHPMLAALRRAGTCHVYGDSADVGEIGALVHTGDAVWEEIDGSTANQPLVRKVFERYLAAADVEGWVAAMRGVRPEISAGALLAHVYAILAAATAKDVIAAFASGRPWGASVQIHMNLAGDPAAAVRLGHMIRAMVPTAVVKVPFTPHAPACLLVARDLERAGIPVNFTSTFSARQTVVAALLADVSLTNIFMGRINQGMEATLLGEHVDLAAQRALRGFRRDGLAKTLLIVASVRDWQTFVHTAGCDVFTAPCSAIAGFLEQTEFPPEAIVDAVERSYLDTMTIGAAAETALGRARIARLYDVEPELVEFLVALRGTAEFAAMTDGEALVRRFEEAGFGDLFYAPTAAEWQELRRSKLPVFGAGLTGRLALDTLYTLLADADFEKYQEEMDALLLPRLG
jgi:transaldolase